MSRITPDESESRRQEARGTKLILVAADDSKQAAWAARTAAGLATALGARVVLVHVINPMALATPEMAGAAADLRGAMRQMGQELLDELRKQFAPDTPLDTLIRDGDAGEEVAAAAREWGADLVVVGTHGRGRLATFLLGSTAEAVIRKSHCPVITVAHDPDRPAVTPGGAGRWSADAEEVVGMP